MTDGDSITVLAFGAAATALGWTRREFPLAARLGDVVAVLEAECPRLAEARGRLRYAVNETLADPDAPLRAGDEIAVIPPVSGGESSANDAAPAVVAALTHEPIDVAALLAEVGDPGCGAVAAFVGVVRAERHPEDGRELRALEYSSYESMAGADLNRIAREALEQHGLTFVRVIHRLGRLGIGEASVAVVVSSAHRAAAFAGCRVIIEQLKVSTPIFKREIWDGGDATWVDDI